MGAVYGCNLCCPYCLHFGQILSGMMTLEDAVGWCNGWFDRVAPQQFWVLGGEPLLNPQIAEILEYIAIRLRPSGHQVQTLLGLLTNGLLLPKMSAKFFDVLRTYQYRVDISLHDEKDTEQLTENIKLLSDCDVRLRDKQQHRRQYEMIAGNPMPIKTDPVVAYRHCRARNLGCCTLMDNKLYKCARIAYTVKGIEQRKLDTAWNYMLDYQPATMDMSDGELEEWIRVNCLPDPVCRGCGTQNKPSL